MKVYIAGPMTGYPEHNYPAFTKAAAILRGLGFEVHSPHEEHPNTEAPYNTWTWEQFLRADLRVMLECDMVATLPGWHESKGANLEVSTARAVGIKDAPVWLLEFGQRVL